MIAIIAIYDWLIVSGISLYKFKRLLRKIVKKTMAHLLRQMYVDEIDFEAVTLEKIVDFVFTEMIHDINMQQLEKEDLAKQDQTDGNHEERWI